MKKTILIVDDEPGELSTLLEMLEAGQFRLETATSGREARRLIDRKGDRFHAVLLDWNLKDDDGLDLLRWIKGRPDLGDVEVVVESSAFVPENVQTGIACGAFYYLTKPFEEAQLRAILGAAVATTDLKRALAEKIAETEDSLRLLSHGTFHLRTPDEAHLLAVHLGSVCGDPQKGVGLLELMLNAIEHGNLGITYEEKGLLRARRGMREEVFRRLELPEYRDRKVEVELTRQDGAIVIEIADEGEGFDFERYLVLDEERLFHSHGRGVLLASSALDLEYVPPGNRVRVVLEAGC
jgi:CheY-like chemotaxis protein